MFGHRNVPGVIARNVGPQLPDPLRERCKGHQLEIELEKITGSGTGFHPAKPAAELEAAGDVRGLGESQAGRRAGLIPGRGPFGEHLKKARLDRGPDRSLPGETSGLTELRVISSLVPDGV